jgi:hypothetical protein
MKREITLIFLLFLFGIGFLSLGVYLFSFSITIHDKSMQMFSFIISICDIVFGSWFIIFTLKHSKNFSRKTKDDKISWRKRYLIDSANYAIFSLILIFFLLDLLIVGIIFLLSQQWYWNLYSGVFLSIATSILISYAPWHDVIKNKIYKSSFEHLFTVFIAMLISIIAFVAIRYFLLE